MNHGRCGIKRHTGAASRRRAYFLTEIIGVFGLLVAAAALLIAGVLTATRAQRRAAEIANGHTVISSLFDAIREDTRSASAAQPWASPAGSTVFDLVTGERRVRYTLAGDRAKREVFESRDVPDDVREWRIEHATLSAEWVAEDGAGEPPTARGPRSRASLLTARVFWRGQSKREVDPTRRFEATFFVGRGYTP